MNEHLLKKKRGKEKKGKCKGEKKDEYKIWRWGGKQGGKWGKKGINDGLEMISRKWWFPHPHLGLRLLASPGWTTQTSAFYEKPDTTDFMSSSHVWICLVWLIPSLTATTLCFQTQCGYPSCPSIHSIVYLHFPETSYFVICQQNFLSAAMPPSLFPSISQRSLCELGCVAGNCSCIFSHDNSEISWCCGMRSLYSPKAKHWTWMIAPCPLEYKLEFL